MGRALASTFLIDHFDLFGSGKSTLRIAARYTPPPFRASGLYRIVRHPIMLGFLLAFWSTPAMTIGHLLFAVATTAYIFVALRLEERDLVASTGEQYNAYRKHARMLLPIPRLWKSSLHPPSDD